MSDVIYKWPVTVPGIWTNVLAGVNSSKLLASSKKEAGPVMNEAIFLFLFPLLSNNRSSF